MCKGKMILWKQLTLNSMHRDQHVEKMANGNKSHRLLPFSVFDGRCGGEISSRDKREKKNKTLAFKVKSHKTSYTNFCAASHQRLGN